MTFNDDRLRDRLKALADFLPVLEDPHFACGEMIYPKHKAPNVFYLPFYHLSAEASAFMKMTYEKVWVLKDFDWGRWMFSPEAVRLRDDPEALASAGPEQLARLLTVVVRQERFCEGSFAEAHESGLLVGIVRRAAALLAKLDGGTLD